MRDAPPEPEPVRDPSPPAADRVSWLPRGLAAWTAVAIVAIAAFILVGQQLASIGTFSRAHALARTAIQTGAAGVALSTLLIALTGDVSCLAMAWARRATEARRRIVRNKFFPLSSFVLSLSPGVSARCVQGSVVPLGCLLACLAGWTLRPALGAPTPEDCAILAAALLGLAFLALFAERSVAAMHPAALPEAAALRALLLLPPIGLALAAGVEILVALGLDASIWVNTALIAVTVITGLELGARALGRWFLPPPPAATARAAVESLIAAMLAGSLSRDGFSAPIRNTFGIDFSRSWALGYLRAAALPALLLTALLCWGLSGLTAVNLDERGVYERLGAPVAVLRPGLHLVLPWPLGRVRRVELGVMHEMVVGGAADTRAATDGMTAEAPPPPAADRLWDQTHPGEASFLIASESAGRQGFQTVNADIRVLTRVGLTDRDALRAAYGTADPETLVREIANRRLSRYFAARTLDQVLGERRESMAEALRAAIAADLAPAETGQDIMAVVIEAVHPPAGAAAAYHRVQAARIEATATIAGEQARARGTSNQARQEVRHVVDAARGAAAESVQSARADLIRFSADREAAAIGGNAFLLERYFGDLSAALAKAPLTIVDHRIAGADGPVIDLRPVAGATTATSEDPD